MRLTLITLLSGGLLFLSGCTTPAPIEYDEQPSAPIQTIESTEPTVQSEIPTSTDDDIVTQGDTSL